MRNASALAYEHSGAEAGQDPLDANVRLYSFEEIVTAPAYFALDGEPVQLSCAGLESDNDGYNPSGVQAVKVKADDSGLTEITIVRTEQDSGAYSAESRFCQYSESGQLTELEIERQPWEDAAICVLPDGRFVTSGVRVIWNQDDPTKHDRFFTEFYIGNSLEEQTYLGQSPDGHKDSRLGVIDNQIILWTRPQQKSFEGKIHYTRLLNIDELSGVSSPNGELVAGDVYERCQPVGAGIFADGTWGGPNGAVDIGDGWALIQCHVSRQLWAQEEILEYDGFMLLHHPASGKAMIFGSHISESQFPAGGAKWPKVRRVAFPGGLHDVQVGLDGNLTGGATVGVRDKDMYAIRWKTKHSINRFLKLLISNS